ncbi:hypothetical protein [Xanthobacter sediminis]
MWNDPVTSTPSIVQTDFGPWGSAMPADGEAYCGPTSAVMGLYWLASNGFTQLAPATYGGPDDEAAISLERVIAGLVGSSPTGGTGPLTNGMADYLAACGIGTDKYWSYISENPDFSWFDTQLAPNFVADSDAIVLAAFAVGWFYKDDEDCQTACALTDNGGHYLVPLRTDPFEQAVTINNSYPASFFNVPNVPSRNPQTVSIQKLPEGWTWSGQSYPSEDYSRVVTGLLTNYGCYAILWYAESWAISADARPDAPDYAPSPWVIGEGKVKGINTNGGTLTVVAPLTGRGSLTKRGEGTMLLTSTNTLLGRITVANGTLASTQASGSPFGSYVITLQNGAGLHLAPETSDPVTVEIAAGPVGSLVIDSGGGNLRLGGTSSYSVTIGGQDDGATPNIRRSAGGTLVILPGGGIAALGADQQVWVTGTGGNLPPVTDGIVPPYILGADAASGAFLTYGAGGGFSAAETTLSSSLDINAVSSGTVYEVVDSQTVAFGGAPQVAALELNGGGVAGSGAQLRVGSQASGTVAGIVMNGGGISVDTLAFGAAEAVIYTAAGASLAISSALGGTGGLTTFGPGTLSLSGDSGAGLSGKVNVNAGTLVAAGPSATGAGKVVVHTNAVLEVSGSVSGAITVGEGARLFLDGGTAAGSVTIAAAGVSDSSPASALPGGVIEGGGIVAGAASIGGIIRSGPRTGILEFQAKTTVDAQAMIYWRLERLVDDTTSKPGEGWNAIRFDSAQTTIGSSTGGPMLLLDFSALHSDPDGGDPFWAEERQWTFITAPADIFFNWSDGNFDFVSGSFSASRPDYGPNLYLQWTPAATPRPRAALRRALARGLGAV